MEKQLLKNIVDFCSKLESVDLKWKETTKAADKNIDILKNQIEQLRSVNSPEIDKTELCNVDGLRERLIFMICLAMDDEADQLRDAVARLNNYSQDLKNVLKNINETRTKLSLKDEKMEEQVNGTVHRPKLNSLLRYAHDACDYYHNLYVGISDNLKALDYKDVKSVERLAKSFREPVFPRMEIDRILAYTQFIARETVR